MSGEAYIEVRPGESGGWCFVRRAANHRRGRASKPYTRWDHAARAAATEWPELEVRVFTPEGKLARVMQPEY